MSYPSYIGELYFNRESQRENPKSHPKNLAYYLCRLTLHIERKLRPQLETINSVINTEYKILGDENQDSDLDKSNREATCKVCPLNRHGICIPETQIVDDVVETHAILKPSRLQHALLKLAGLIGYQDTSKFSHVALVSEINPDFQG